MPDEGPRRAAALNALWRGAGCDTLRLGAAMGPPNQGNQAIRDETPNFTFARLDLTPNAGVLAKLRHMPLAQQPPHAPAVHVVDGFYRSLSILELTFVARAFAATSMRVPGSAA